MLAATWMQHFTKFMISEIYKSTCEFGRWKGSVVPKAVISLSFGWGLPASCFVNGLTSGYLPGLWSKAGDLLDAGSTIFVGPAGCGKTTILRDVAVNMSKELQVPQLQRSSIDLSCSLPVGHSKTGALRDAWHRVPFVLRMFWYLLTCSIVLL